MASAPGQAAYEASCGCEEKMCWLTKANQVVMYNLLLCVDVSHLIFFHSCLLSSMFMLYLSCVYFKDKSFNFFELYTWKYTITMPSK